MVSLESGVDVIVRKGSSLPKKHKVIDFLGILWSHGALFKNLLKKKDNEI